MTRRGVWLLAALAAACAVWVTWRPAPLPGPASAAGAPARSAPRGLSSGGEPAADPAAIRDLFRFVTRSSAPPARPAARPAPRLAVEAPPVPGLPRLVGLVRRQGRLLAAFAVDGDVVLAGPGETAAGLSVIAVGEDGVTIRRPDGSEERLALP